jgi:hypothetical protein
MSSLMLGDWGPQLRRGRWHQLSAPKSMPWMGEIFGHPPQRTGRSAPHIAQAGADVDRRCRSQWHRTGGAVCRDGTAGAKLEDLVK